MKYPLAKQTITNRDLDKLIAWLKTYPRLTMGDVTKEFEQKWAEYIGTKYAVFVNSGSSANLLMIYALLMTGRLKAGDKVAVPAVGWGTTIAPLIQLGLKPVMVDVDPFVFGMSPTALKRELKKGGIRAIMFVQVLGVPALVDDLVSLADEYEIPLLEDACAALGSSCDDKMVGTFGSMSTFSFYFGHQLSTIEGGMINTDDIELYETILMARSHGWGKDLSAETYDKIMAENGIDIFHSPFTFFIPGFNLRPTDFQAYIGLGQIEKAEWCAKRRHENHERYIHNFDADSHGLDFQAPNLNDRISSISFGLIANSTEERKTIVTNLVDHGIETRLFSAGNLGLHPFWEDYNRKKSNFSVANIIHSRGLFLPNYPELTLDDVDYISNVVLESL